MKNYLLAALLLLTVSFLFSSCVQNAIPSSSEYEESMSSSEASTVESEISASIPAESIVSEIPQSEPSIVESSASEPAQTAPESSAAPSQAPAEKEGKITMQMVQKKYPLATETVEVIITNGTSQESGYGMSYRIERGNGGTWEAVPLDFAVIEIYAILNPGQSNTEKIALFHEQYGYTPGEYRVIKQIGDKEYSANFTLE